MSAVVLDPLVPWAVLYALAGMMFAGAVLALWRSLSGALLRVLASLALLAVLAQPSWRTEERASLPDIVLMLVDESASQHLANREAMTNEAAMRLEAALRARPNTEIRKVVVADGEDNDGTRLMSALAQALAEEPRGRIAGIFMLSDGRLHDMDRAPDLPAPLHLLQTGREGDWDRRLIVQNAPAFAIMGEEVTLTLRIQDDGAAPDQSHSDITISLDGAPPERYRVPIGQDLSLPLTLPHGGMNVIEFTVPETPGELTTRNNSALVQINGVRDRLRVLLVSGEPHAGGRTWRNLLKSDSAVDLVHFTILRPPEKQDGVPVQELSLIAFPTRELFLEKIGDFDLIIFDRYKRRGILPALYLDNVRAYVEGGGAVLVAAGPDFAGAQSLYRSPLGDILPAEPSARVFEKAYRPSVTETGARHPVTAGLEGTQDWGSWLRQIELERPRGDVLLSGLDDKPLLVLNRVGEGRVALLASDQAWLWARGYEGGGPQQELLRRLAHWMMKEPELEEEALQAEPIAGGLRVIRRSLQEQVEGLTVTMPDGETLALPMKQVAPGQFEAFVETDLTGLFRLEQGEIATVAGLGPPAPREFEQTIASAETLAPLITQNRGGVFLLEDGLPRLRDVRMGRPAAGRGWAGLTPRGAYDVTGIQQTQLLPAWAGLLLVIGLILAAWLREGRRG